MNNNNNTILLVFSSQGSWLPCISIHSHLISSHSLTSTFQYFPRTISLLPVPHCLLFKHRCMISQNLILNFFFSLNKQDPKTNSLYRPDIAAFTKTKEKN